MNDSNNNTNNNFKAQSLGSIGNVEQGAIPTPPNAVEPPVVDNTVNYTGIINPVVNETSNPIESLNETPVMDNNEVLSTINPQGIIDANPVISDEVGSVDDVPSLVDTEEIINEASTIEDVSPINSNTNYGGVIPDPNINNFSTIQDQSVISSPPINTFNDQQNLIIDNSLNEAPTPPVNTIGMPNNQTTEPTDDEELLKAFIGKNYDKITTRKFSFSGFFFSSLYMCYRKMFLYGLIEFIISTAVSSVAEIMLLNFYFAFILDLIVQITLGFIVNQIYISFAKSKIKKIKKDNAGKDINELKSICASKGGTSIGLVVLQCLIQGVILVVSIILIVVWLFSAAGVSLMDFIENTNFITDYDIDSTDDNDTTNSVKVEDVTVSGYLCFSSSCSVTIVKDGVSTTYDLNIDNTDLFIILGDYSDYITLNIYYTEIDGEYTIVDYELYITSTYENINDIKTEDELRSKLGLYSEGTYILQLTLTNIGTVGVGYSNDEAYTYVNYTFVDSNNTQYEMKYKNPPDTSSLVVGNTYTITFSVTEGSFDYEYSIISID